MPVAVPRGEKPPEWQPLAAPPPKQVVQLTPPQPQAQVTWVLVEAPPLPSGVRQMVQRQEEIIREREVQEAYRRVGWTPERVQQIMAPQPPKPILQQIGETWQEPGLKPEFIASELVFRKLWDPAYKARYEAEYKAWEASKGGARGVAQLREEQARQIYLATSAAIIGLSAYEMARGAYAVAKWEWMKRQPDWYSDYAAVGYQPKEPYIVAKIPQEPSGYEISVSRGTPTTPMTSTLEKVLTKGQPLGGLSTRQLLQTEPLTSEVVPKLPLIEFEPLYTPKYMGERIIDVGAVTTIGSIPSFRITEFLIPSLIGISTARPSIAPRGITVPKAPTRELTITKPSISEIQVPTQAVTQIQEVTQVQEVSQIQKQLQRQLLDIPTPTRVVTVTTFQPPPFFDEFTRRRKKRKAPIGFDLIGRYGRINPIMEAKKALKRLL